jgi:hypothetical protein
VSVSFNKDLMKPKIQSHRVHSRKVQESELYTDSVFDESDLYLLFDEYIVGVQSRG